MIKKFFCMTVAFTFIFTSSINVFAYNRTNAKTYAEKWAEPRLQSGAAYNSKLGQYYNPSYYRASPYDCTNFASQVLAAGGCSVSSTLPEYASISYWRPNSATWENADYFNRYWRDKGKSKAQYRLKQSTPEAVNGDMYRTLFAGDVVQYGMIDSSITYPVSGIDYQHSQVVHNANVVYNGRSTMYLASHTSDRKNINLYEYLRSTSKTYVHSFNMN